MPIDVKVPSVGESISEGILAVWKVADGAVVKVDDALYELETDKVFLTVVAEAAGRISRKVPEGATVQIGATVASIEAEAGVASSPQIVSNAVKSAAAEDGKPQSPPVSPPAGIETLKANLKDLAPSVRHIVAEAGLDAATISGTGKGGRITKEDALKALESPPSAAPPDPIPPPLSREPQALSLAHRQTRRPMSSLRQRIAERMVASQQTTATLTTFNEVDMSALLTLRAQHQEAFLKRYDVKLGIMSFFVKASIEALRSVPEVNAQIDGDLIVENHYYDIGVAVSTARGLVVPVIRDADQMSFGELEQAIALYAEKARSRTLTLDELQGGVFTISNGGVFGSMLSTPILNPPQAAILGLHGIKKRPVVINDDRIEVRPMMYLALSYDHRLIDGRESVTFLKRIVECVEAPEKVLLGL